MTTAKLQPNRTGAYKEFKDECDINRIVKAARGTLDLGFSPQAMAGSMLDISHVGDFQAINERMLAVKNEFQKLPALVQARFNNNPSECIKYLEDPKNRDEAIALGMLPKVKKSGEKPEEVKPDEPAKT